eukprot:9674940-Alexandrium_andersonii.AAC.1
MAVLSVGACSARATPLCRIVQASASSRSRGCPETWLAQLSQSEARSSLSRRLEPGSAECTATD